MATAAALLALAPTAFGASLPDNRFYEQVSPVNKEGTDIEPAPAMGAIDGNRLMFVSRGSFAGQPTTLSAEQTSYLATRGPAGWSTKGIALPNGALSFGSEGYMGFNQDMSKGILGWYDDTRFGPYDPSARPGYNLYMRDSTAGSFQLVNGTLSSLNNDQGFIWGTPDFSRLALDSAYPLTADSPCTGVSHCAYEWDSGTLRLASVLPGGDPVQGSVGNTPFTCNFEHAMSDDGLRLFFTSLEGSEGEHQIYARENGISSTLVSGSERALPGGAIGFSAKYQSAEAAHGDKILFTTQNSLVDADANSTNDLYMYDFTQPVGERLTLVSEDQNPDAPEGAAVAGAGDCGGLVAASEDLERVYFVATNQIVAGEPEGGGPKLYLWDDSGGSPQLAYIGTLDPSDGPSVAAAPAVHVRNGGIPRQARWNRDGRYLAFISTASLTGFDNEGEREIYRYDAVSGSLDCLTCDSDAFPANGEVAFQTHYSFIRPVNHLPQNVSDSGQVFFQTTRGLGLGDSNGKRDVYEYDGQHLNLISKGNGDSHSSFLDATPTGSDVFFTTRDQLVGWDRDGNLDAYDARVGGGFPEPGFVPPPCEGEACLPAALAPNDPTPGSSSFNGAGNVSQARRCKAGKVRRQGKCRKKRQSTRQRHHGKPATRSQG